METCLKLSMEGLILSTDTQIPFWNFKFVLRNFILFFQMLYRNCRKIWWKVSVLMCSFSNDESTSLPMLLKTDSTTDILLTKSTTFRTSITKNAFERLLLFIKSILFKSMLDHFHNILRLFDVLPNLWKNHKWNDAQLLLITRYMRVTSRIAERLKSWGLRILGN